MARAKSRRRKSYLCFDLGGTKLFAALIDVSGKILAHDVLRINQARGLEGLIKNFEQLGLTVGQGRQQVVSVASAGPLHAERGVLLDPTNFFTDQKSWGIVPLVARLRRVFKVPVLLENDAAAAALAEGWKGRHGRRGRNLVAITLGTGVGIGVLANGALIRAGQGLHPEASHIPINVEDRSYPCGCGAYGCIEANLGGTHFAKRLSLKLGQNLDGNACLKMAEEGNVKALAAFADYGRRLALAVRTFAVLFAPEVVVLSGGFAKASPYFLPAAEGHLPELLARYREGVDLLPQLRISRLGDTAGVLGAAAVVNLRLGKKKGRS